MYSIYTHRNPNNNKQYIGQSNNPQERWRRGYKGTRFGDIIDELGGLDKFEHFILKDNLTKEEANYWEEYYIKMYDTTNPNFGYNTQLGRLDKDTKNNRMIQKELRNNANEHKKENYLYKETKEKYIAHFILKEIYKTTKNNFIMCIETKDIFKSMKEAGKWAGLTDHSRLSIVKDKKNLHAGMVPNTQIKASWRTITKNEIKEIITQQNIQESKDIQILRNQTRDTLTKQELEQEGIICLGDPESWKIIDTKLDKFAFKELTTNSGSRKKQIYKNNYIELLYPINCCTNDTRRVYKAKCLQTNNEFYLAPPSTIKQFNLVKSPFC